MATDAEDPGFLSRWSRRKAQVRQGSGGADGPEIAIATKAPAPTSPAALPSSPDQPPAPAQPAVVAEPLPTLADVAALTRESDYSRFVARSVQPDVKNAALAKLFTDPHFNVMDGLDTYIDDYGKPDPLPAGMLRQMLQAHVLGLFDDEEDDGDDAKKHPPAGATALQAETPAVPPIEQTPEPPAKSPTDENTDLQLQPDDDAGRRGLEPGAGEDTGCTH